MTVFVITRNPGKQGKWFESYGGVELGRKASFDVNFWGFFFFFYKTKDIGNRA